MSRDYEYDQTIARWLSQTGDRQEFGTTIKPSPTRADGDAILQALRERSQSGASIRIDEELGKGGMGEVRRGEQTALRREVAIKRLRHSSQPEAVAALVREAWLTAALEHPNIVPVYELGVDEAGAPIVVMRRIHGTEWGHYIENAQDVCDRFGATSALEWHLRVLVQVCSATHYAHSQGVIHRDIKPRNVMIGSFGEVYLFDWGIAIPKRGPLLALLGDSTEAAIAGTVCYLAPEMLEGDLSLIDVQTDVYLLGATLFEILVGAPPHPGSSFVEILEHVRSATIEIPASIPDELRGILECALHRDKRKRYQSADELRRAIELYLSHRASDRLSVHAREALSSLREQPLTQEGNDNVDWKTLYQLFRKARFGYGAALDLWSENQRAQEGLHETAEYMIRLELRHGTPAAAAALLAELQDPPEQLVADVQRATERYQSRRQEMSELAFRGRTLSPETEASARGAAIFCFGTVFAAKSLFLPELASETHLFVNAIVILIVGSLLYLLRFALFRTSFNRRAVGSVVLLAVVTATVRLLGQHYGQDAATLSQLDGSIQMMAVMMAVVVFSFELWPIVPGYVLACAFAFAAPAHYYEAEAFAHLIFGVFAGFLWHPKTESTSSVRLHERD